MTAPNHKSGRHKQLRASVGRGRESMTNAGVRVLRGASGSFRDFVSQVMLRGFFLALGIYAFILGLECLVLDKAVLQPSRDSSAAALAQQAAPSVREVTPAEWAPWSLLSAGAVVTLYSFTIPAKMRG